MARTFVRLTQIRKSDSYTDNIAPTEAAYETNTVSIEDDLNSLRSQIQNIINRDGAEMPAGSWYDNISTPSTFEGGSKRGVSELNSQLHDLERKRVLLATTNLTDVTVTSGSNFVVLSLGQLPTANSASIGAVSTLGTVAAYEATFGANSLAEVAGSTAIAPKNLCEIVDGSTRDQILSDNRVVYALFQTESNTDGSGMTGTTPARAQLSFVRINATGDDLEAAPSGDIAGKVINYASVTRKALEDLNEQDFLRGAMLDNLGSSLQNLQVVYDNQGVTPVEVTTDSILDLNSSGISWEIRDLVNAQLFSVTEGSTGGSSDVTIAGAVDTFTVSAVENNFSAGATFNTSGNDIEIGVTSSTIASTGSDALHLVAAGSTLSFDDSNRAGSTLSTAIPLSTSSTEWSNFETNFGEVSLVNAINQAFNADRRSKVYAVVTADAAADANVSANASNLDVTLGDLSLGSFSSSYDLFLNGELLRPGANNAANNDYYPGTDLSLGEIKFEFPVKVGDVLTLVSFSTKIA